MGGLIRGVAPDEGGHIEGDFCTLRLTTYFQTLASTGLLLWWSALVDALQQGQPVSGKVDLFCQQL